MPAHSKTTFTLTRQEFLRTKDLIDGLLEETEKGDSCNIELARVMTLSLKRTFRSEHEIKADDAAMERVFQMAEEREKKQ